MINKETIELENKFKRYQHTQVNRAGKTCLAKRYIAERNSDDESNNGDTEKKEFSMRQDPTIGVDHFKKTIKINIWDTAGQDKYFSITKNFFQKADGVILTFDLTDNQSFKMVQDYWIQQVNDYSGEQVKKILVGNKVDKQDERKINSLQGAELAQKYNMNYFETSALTGESVILSIETLAKQCAFSIQEHRMSPTIDIVEPKKPTNNMNCFGTVKDVSSKILSMIVPSKKDKKKSNTPKKETPQTQFDGIRQQQLQDLNQKETDQDKQMKQTQQ